MPLANPYQKYQQTAVKTADRGDLLILTYEAIVRWLSRAEEAIDAEKVPDAHNALMAAQALIRNLADSLDFERGGETAANLGALYEYMMAQLLVANVQKSKQLVAEVRELVLPLLEAWRVAVPQARKTGELV